MLLSQDRRRSLNALRFLSISRGTLVRLPTSLESVRYAPLNWELTGCRGGVYCWLD